MIGQLTDTDTGLWLTPEAAVCVLGEAVFLQSSELVEDVDVGVIGTAVVLLPERSGTGVKTKYFPARGKKKISCSSTVLSSYIYQSMPLTYLCS